MSNWRPSVTVTGSAGTQRIDSQSSFSTVKQTTSPKEARLSVIQPIFRGGRTLADTQRSKLEVRAQRAALRSVEQDVLLRAATSYMDVWRDQAVLKLNLNNEKVLERQLEASNDRFTVGEVTRTDVAQSETRLAVATAGRISAEGDLSASKAVYEEIIGAVPGQVQAPPPLAELPGTVDQSVE
ncbi:MAG: TolC family protein, partial [Alphaproteobacteria bacterium]